MGTQLNAYETMRDLAADLLESVQQMKAAQFASLLGVSVRTLQGWEQGRKQPSGAARTLLPLNP